MDATASVVEPAAGPAERPDARPRPLPRRALLFPAALAAVLLWCSHFPLSWGWLAWVALVPLLALARQETPLRRILPAAWLAGLLFFVPVLQWLRVADPRMYVTWLGLAVYCALYIPLAVGLVRLLDRRTALPLVLTLPVVWVSLEYLRAHLFTGFAWYFLAHTQHDFAPLIQIADLTGTYGVSFLVAAGNALLFELLCRWPRFRIWFKVPAFSPAWRPLAVVVLLIAASLGYGGYRLRQDDFAAGPRVALVQSDLSQALRNDSGGDSSDQVLAHNSRLSSRASDQRPDLIVWPETSYPGYWVEVAPGAPATPEQYRAAAECREIARDVARSWPTDVLLGMNSEITAADGGVRLYNSALLLRPPGAVVARYDKMHRVPFGEYVPLRETLPWLNAFAPYDFDYSVSVGESFTRFPLGKYHFGVIICYEDSDAALARHYVGGDGADAAPVDFLLNISNDGWFNGTSEHEEHLAICRFRAVECRRAVLRAVNMGISAVIDGNGRVLRPELVKSYAGGVKVWEAVGGEALPVGRWAEFKRVAGVLLGTVPLDERGSLYARWGDWFPRLCTLLLCLALTVAVVRPGNRHE